MDYRHSVTRCFSQLSNNLPPSLRLISRPNDNHSKRDEGSNCHIYGNTISRDLYMLTSKNLTLGTVTQSRTALALFAATLLVGGSVTEASAKSRHHRHHHHHSHHASNSPTHSSWRDANASIAPSSGTGRSFSGIASFYGNES